MSAEVALALREEIERTGYYPNLVSDALESALGQEVVVDFLVHHEPTFDRSDEIRRHITVMLLTATRLILLHVDEHSDLEPGRLQATAACETVPLRMMGPVVVQRMIDDPARYRPGDLPAEVLVTVSWGSRSTVDLEPATCGDPQCEADHGYTGTLARDDWALRVSMAADGERMVRRVLEFATRLIAATSH